MEEKLAKIKAKTEDETALPESNEPAELEQIDAALNKEIEKKLKSRGQPIRLFAETDRQRMARLKMLEMREEELSGGQRNDFYELLEKEQAEAEAAAEEKDGKRKGSSSESILPFETIDDVKEKIDLSLLLKDRKSAINNLDIFFRVLIKEWQINLDLRPEEVKKSTAGRMASATFQQTKEYLAPFFRLLQRDELPADILAHVVDIVGFLQEREYVRANDTYLRLSIGNAPWPIGVTMVGIHERSAHEKINSGSVAHALNDEVTRKWIQSIKRLMTFCQKVHPPSEPSKAMG